MRGLGKRRLYLIRFVTNKEMGHLFCGFTVRIREQ